MQPVLDGPYAVKGLTLDGGTILSGNGNLTLGNGGVIATGTNNAFTLSNITLHASQTWDIGLGSLSVSSAIAGPAAAVLTKAGSGSLILTGAITYSGDTTVTGGTLSLTQPNPDNDASTVTLAAGAVLELAFTGTDTVDKLFINGAQQAAGDYTQSHSSGTLAGAGTLRVSSGPSGYDAWATANAPGPTADLDHDSDGVQNGIESFMGLSGSGFTANPAPDANGRVTWPMAATYSGVYGTDYVVQIATDLVAWSDVPQSGVTIVSGVSVSHMSRIRGHNTKPELALRSMLHRLGYRFTVNGPNNKKLPGKPDIVLPKYRTVVFVHGGFWHGHELCPAFRLPKSRTEWWTPPLLKIRCSRYVRGVLSPPHCASPSGRKVRPMSRRGNRSRCHSVPQGRIASMPRRRRTSILPAIPNYRLHKHRDEVPVQDRLAHTTAPLIRGITIRQSRAASLGLWGKSSRRRAGQLPKHVHPKRPHHRNPVRRR